LPYKKELYDCGLLKEARDCLVSPIVFDLDWQEKTFWKRLDRFLELRDKDFPSLEPEDDGVSYIDLEFTFQETLRKLGCPNPTITRIASWEYCPFNVWS